jgi:hypothetical protein
MSECKDPSDSTPSTASAASAKASDDPSPEAAVESHREHEQLVSEEALDEALEMTFPASDPVAL